MSQFYGELRVDNGLRKVKVNDQGEYIEFSVNDSTFFDKYADMLSWVTKKHREVEQNEAENMKKIRSASSGEDTAADQDTLEVDMIRELARMRTEFYRECCQKLDLLFGEGCCKKVFGNVVPDDLLIEDFLEQITPILEKLGKERNEKLSLKYNRNRKGANSKLSAGNV